MPLLYFLFIKLVEFLLPLVAFFTKNKKIKLFVNGRKNIFTHLDLPLHSNRYWFHCASLGEFEQARPVIEKLKSNSPDVRIVISFFSPSGFEQRKTYDLAEAVIYLPLDTPYNAIRLIRAIKPKAVVFVKYEIWYFLLKSLFRSGLPVYLISANFRKNQAIFSFWGKWLFKLLPQYKQIFLQNEAAFALLKEKGLSNIMMSGDTRYDRVLQNAGKVKENEIIASFQSNKPLMILGSSWPVEENILLQYLESFESDTSSIKKQKYRIIIAPHDISDKHISEIQIKFKKWQPALFTEINLGSNSNILILNTIGHLASAYNYADLAFIGGGFSGQLHNILEPLAFGAAVVCGPIHYKFPEAESAMKEGVLLEVSDAVSFMKTIHELDKQSLKTKAKEFILHHAGASELVVQSMLG